MNPLTYDLIKILALFECSAHPQHSSERIRASLVNLDSLIRNLSLTSIDSHDRTACRFSLGRVPVVQTDTPLDTFAKEYKCSCISPDMLDPLNQDCSLSWDPSWSPHQISDEEVRRLCWSSLAIISDYVLHCEMFNDEPPRFYVTEPSNVGQISHVLSFWGSSFDSMFCFSLGKSSIEFRQHFVSKNLSRQRNPFGHSTVAACSFGIFVIATKRLTSKLTRTSTPMKQLLKPKQLRTHSMLTLAISTLN